MQVPSFMPARLDLFGQKFGLLTVTNHGISIKSAFHYDCQCDCGNTILMSSQRLRKETEINCGCVQTQKRNKVIGKAFGRWTVTSEKETRSSPAGNVSTYYVCECSCGNKKWVSLSNLNNGTSTSCGCWKIEATKLSNTSHGHARRSGRTKKEEVLYRTWNHIKARCYNPSSPDFKLYGGQGVTMSNEWLDNFGTFWIDVGPTWKQGSSLQRYPNPFGNFDRDNWRWATQKELENNRKDSKRPVLCDGIYDSVSGTALRIGISSDSLSFWIKRGFTPQQIADQHRSYKGQRSTGLFPELYHEKHWKNVTCDWCGKTTSRMASMVRDGKMYCNQECLGKGRTAEGNNQWKGGMTAWNSRAFRGKNWTHQAARARKRDEYTCQYLGCSKTQKELGVTFHVHHIVPFYNFTDKRKANALKNLITYCPSHHIMEEAKNKTGQQLVFIGKMI